MKLSCVPKAAANEDSEPLVETGNPEVLQQQAAASSLATEATQCTEAAGNSASTFETFTPFAARPQPPQHSAHARQRAHTTSAGLPNNSSSDSSSSNALHTDPVSSPFGVERRVSSATHTSRLMQRGTSLSSTLTSHHAQHPGPQSLLQGNRSESEVYATGEQPTRPVDRSEHPPNDQGSLRADTSYDAPARYFDFGSPCTPMHESHESLLKFVRHHLPSRATPEAKMLYLKQKEALLEQKAKALARRQVWGPNLGFLSDGHGVLVPRQCCPQCGNRIIPVSAQESSSGGGGLSTTGHDSSCAFGLAAAASSPPPLLGSPGEHTQQPQNMSRPQGPLATLQLVPRPVTLPWLDDDGEPTTAKSSSLAGPRAQRTGGDGNTGNTFPPSDRNRNNGGGGIMASRTVTRVVRMTASDHHGIELAFDLTFRPTASNPCSPSIPDADEAERESPTPDEFYQAIAQVPFVLTYLHGDNDLSEDSSRLAYAVPVVRTGPSEIDSESGAGAQGRLLRSGGAGESSCDERSRGLGAGGVSSDFIDGAGNADVTDAAADDDGFGDPLHCDGSGAAGTQSSLEVLQTASMLLPDTATSVSGAYPPLNSGTRVYAAATAAKGSETKDDHKDKKHCALKVQRMNRKWRVVFPFVSFAPSPKTQSVHVLFVSQAPTKFGEIVGLEVPVVIMEPPRIKVRLQQAPPVHRDAADGAEADAFHESDQQSTVPGKRHEDADGHGDSNRRSAPAAARPSSREASFSLPRPKARSRSASSSDGRRGSSWSMSGKNDNDADDETDGGKRRTEDAPRAAPENLSFTSQTPSLFCQLPDDAFLELQPEERDGAMDVLEPGTPAVLTAAHLKRMEEQQQQQQQQQQSEDGGPQHTRHSRSETANVLTITGDPHETQLGRVLLDIEADDIVFDVEFSIRAQIGGRRPVSTYAKEFLPSELIRHVHVPSPLPSGDDVKGGAPSPSSRSTDTSGVISTRWVIPVVAPLVMPLPVALGGAATRSRSPCGAPLSRRASASVLVDPSSLAGSHPSDITGGVSASGASWTAPGRPPTVPPLNPYLSADMAATTGTGTPGQGPSDTAASGTSVIPHRCRLVLQVDVRLASLPRQVFREVFPLTVLFPGASRAASSHCSLTGTPLCHPTVTGVPPPLMLDRVIASAGTRHLNVPATTAITSAPTAAGSASAMGDSAQRTSDAATHSDATATPPTTAAAAASSSPASGVSLPHGASAMVEAVKNIIPLLHVTQHPSLSVAGSASTPVGLGPFNTTSTATGVATPKAGGSGKRHKSTSLASASNTPHSGHLRLSRPASRSPSPSVSPAFSMGSMRKVSLAHVSVSTFAICRSGAILSYYRNHSNPDESELGFSPLNAMNQCAPVNLHGLEKFALLLADRHNRHEEKLREERARKAGAGSDSTSSVKRKHSSRDKHLSQDAISSPKQASTLGTTSPDTDAVESGGLPSGRVEVRQASETKRHHKHRHKHHSHASVHNDSRQHRHTRSGTLDRASEDMEHALGAGREGLWRIFEDAIGWRLERSIDANYVLLRERGTCQCFAFRMRGSRSRHGQDASVGGKRMNKLDLVAVACFEPDLPPLKHFASSDGTSEGGKTVVIRKPVKQQYLLSEREVLTLTLNGDLLLTEASTIEKIRSDEVHSPTTPTGAESPNSGDAPTPLHTATTMASRTSSPGLSAPQQILQQMQNFTLRVGPTTRLPLPGACSRFTAWMLENADNYTLILVATNVSGPENAGYARPKSQCHPHEIIGEEGLIVPAGSAAVGFPYRKVLVYCVEEKRTLYEFQLGIPSSTAPGSPPPSAATKASNDAVPSPSALLPLLLQSISASIRGFTVVSAHEETAMIIAWTSYQADVLSCCPTWSHFSLFFVTPSFVAAMNAKPSATTAACNIDASGDGDEVETEPVDPVEDLLSPLGFSAGGGPAMANATSSTWMAFPGGPSAGKEDSKSIHSNTNNSTESEAGLLTILCVCPGDRAPHALVGAATKEEREKTNASSKSEKQLTARYPEEFLAFFLLSNGSIYALTAPKETTSTAGAASAGGAGASSAYRDEAHNLCTSHWMGGDMYIHVDENGSPPLTSPSTAGVRRDFPRPKAGGSGPPSFVTNCSPSQTASAANTTAPATNQHTTADGPPGEVESRLRVVRVGTVFNACFHTPSAVENCAMRYCPVDRDFLDVRGMLYLYGTHASTKELLKDAIVVE